MINRKNKPNVLLEISIDCILKILENAMTIDH